MIAGAFDYLLKVRTTDIRKYRRFWREDLKLALCRQYLDIRGDGIGQGYGDVVDAARSGTLIQTPITHDTAAVTAVV